MDFQQLQYFVAAAEHRSLSEAAKALDVSQPAVTKGLRKLERTLDAPLLERGTTGVRLTDFGERFYPHARAVLGQLNRGTEAIRELRGDAPATLAVGTTPSFVDQLLPEVIAEFARRWPQVRLRVIKDFAPALAAMTRSGELDLAFMLLGERDLPAGLDYLRLADMEVVFVARPGHVLDTGTPDPVSATRLAAARWILLDSADVQEFVATTFARAGAAPPAPAVVTNSMRLIKTTVMESDLVGFLPRHMVTADLEAGRLVRLRSALDDCSVDAGLACRPGPRRALTSAFIDVALAVSGGPAGGHPARHRTAAAASA